MAGGRITLVDADLRQQELTGFFEASKEAPGLSDKLRDPTSAVPLLGVGPQGLALLPAGSGIVAPGAVLAAPGFARLMASLRREGRLMIVSTSSPLGDSDIAAFSGTVGAAVIVVQAGKTSRRALAATVQRVVAHDIALLGAVLIDVKTKDLHDAPRSLSRTVEPDVTSNR